MENSVPNIYFEAKILETTPTKIWDNFLTTQQFTQLFGAKNSDALFEVNEVGDIELSLGLFRKINAQYHILSYEKNKNLLLDLITPECTSTILVTLEENSGNVLIRLDHRSFVGEKKKQFYKTFYNRWKKIFYIMEKKAV